MRQVQKRNHRPPETALAFDPARGSALAHRRAVDRTGADRGKGIDALASPRLRPRWSGRW